MPQETILGRTSGLAKCIAVVLASGCCEEPIVDVHLGEIADAELQARYRPADDGTLFADIALVSTTETRCYDLLDGARGELSGIAMDQQHAYPAKGCACAGYPGFEVTGANIPAPGDGTFAVSDGGPVVSATVPGLFDAHTVVLRSPLQVGSRVYMDFLPASGSAQEVGVSFIPVSRDAGWENTWSETPASWGVA